VLDQLWLAYLLVDPISTTGLLGTLVVPTTVEHLVVRQGNRCKPRHADAWYTLEHRLNRVIDVLYTRLAGTFDMSIRIQWTRGEFPGWWNQFQTDEAKVVRAAQIVHHMLLRLCSVVSLYAAIARWTRTDIGECLSWGSGQPNPVEDAWLEELKASPVMQFEGVRRRGVFIDTTTTTPFPSRVLHVYLDSGVPIFFKWGSDRAAIPATYGASNFYVRYRPSKDELDTVLPRKTFLLFLPSYPLTAVQLFTNRCISSLCSSRTGVTAEPQSSRSWRRQ
jgi:hypothetical protein